MIEHSTGFFFALNNGLREFKENLSTVFLIKKRANSRANIKKDCA